MRKQYQIRWRDSDTQDLKKAVRNFNAKIRRLEKKNPDNAQYLPDKIKYNEMKNLIKTRQDLNREINALKRFSKRGAEQIVTLPDTDYNIKATKWQKTELNRRAGVINRKREKRLADLESTQLKRGGKELGYTQGQLGMGEAEKVGLKPFNPTTPKMTQSGFKKKWLSALKESQSQYWTEKDMQLKDRYIDSLSRYYNTNDITDVIETIRGMDFNEFYEKFRAEDGQFEFGSPPGLGSAEYEAYVEELHTIWTPNK